MNYKHISLWNMASASLWRYKVKTLSFFLPLTTAIAFTVVLTVISDGFLQDAKLAGKTVPDITIQKLTGGRVDQIDTSVINSLLTYKEISKVVPRVWGYIPMKDNGKDVAYTLMGVDIGLMPPAERIEMSIEKGRYLRAGKNGELVVGKIFAEKYKLSPGSDVALHDAFNNVYTFRVVGIFSMGVQIYTADLLLTSLNDARSFLNYPENKATDLAIYTKSKNSLPRLAQKIAKDIKGSRVLSRNALNKVIEQAYGGRGGIFQLVWIMLILTAGMVAWAEGMTVGTSAKRDVGILKALGWGIGDIIEMKVMEAFMVGCTSFLLGTSFGICYILIDAPGIKDYFLGWASIYPDFPIPVYLSVESMFMIFCISVLPLLFAMMVPAWLIGIMEADAAIRG